jgi:hypothetical protein
MKIAPLQGKHAILSLETKDWPGALRGEAKRPGSSFSMPPKSVWRQAPEAAASSIH